MGSQLSETEIQNSLDFCANLFNPTTPEEHERLINDGRVSKELLDVTTPILDSNVLSEALAHRRSAPFLSDAGDDSSERMVLDKNARKVMNNEYAISNLESEPLCGYVVRLERGNLGLVTVQVD